MTTEVQPIFHILTMLILNKLGTCAERRRNLSILEGNLEVTHV